jgi:uncharacterized membrane protein
MLSNHYPLAFATDWNWMIAGLVFLMGVTIRHFFNTDGSTSNCGRHPRSQHQLSFAGLARRYETTELPSHVPS